MEINELDIKTISSQNFAKLKKKRGRDQTY